MDADLDERSYNGRVRRLPASLVPIVALGALACSSSGARSPQGDGATDLADERGATEVADAATDASHRPPDPPGYDYWWFASCETADGSCPADRCFRNPIEVVPDRCGPYLNLEVGCVPRTTVLAGWFCIMRPSNGELIYTQVSPIGGDWAACTNTLGNLPPAQGALCFDASAAD
jgi:hypothetical protein